WYISGQPTLDTATDDQGQKLTPYVPNINKGRPAFGGGGGGGGAAGGALPPARALPPVGGIAMPWGGWGNQQTVFMQLNLGKKEAKKIKEFKGKLAVQSRTAPEAMITVDKILKAAGKTVKGAKGGSIKVIEAEKDGDGNYKITFELERPDGVIGGG